jgi:predicted nuclease of predicted toxin-antitoxin system
MPPSESGEPWVFRQPDVMRLLFDEQLSERLCEQVQDIFPQSLHVRQLGPAGASDAIVWELARTHRCVLVTKDEDFHRLSVLHGGPPLVVWLRIGNSTTDDVARLLRDRRADIEAFGRQEVATFLALGW